MHIDSQVSQLLVAFLLGGVAMILTERFVRGFRIRGGFGTAVVAGIVYGLLHALLQKVLVVLTLPLVALTMGLFVFVINAFLLWLTSKLVRRVEFRSFGALFWAALWLAVFDVLFHWILHQGALF